MRHWQYNVYYWELHADVLEERGDELACVIEKEIYAVLAVCKGFFGEESVLLVVQHIGHLIPFAGCTSVGGSSVSSDLSNNSIYLRY